MSLNSGLIKFIYSNATKATEIAFIYLVLKENPLNPLFFLSSLHTIALSLEKLS